MTKLYPIQRRYPRAAIEGATLVRCDRNPVTEGFTKTRVIGLGGCGFESDEPLGIGRLVELWIKLPSAAQPVRALGRIVYERSLSPGRYEVGVEFLRVPAEHREAISKLFPADEPHGGEASRSA